MVQGQLEMIQVEHHTYDIFPTLLMGFDLSNLPIKDKVLEIIEQADKNKHYLIPGGVGTYNEEKDKNILEHPDLAMLKTIIQQCVDTYTKKYGLKTVMIGNSWANTLGKGANVRSHRHEMSVVSGAYYPKVDKGSTNLILKNPTNAARMFEFHQADTPYTQTEAAIPPQENMLIIFPSWIEHYTDTNETDTRITISFNTLY